MAFLLDESDVVENSPCGDYVRYDKILGRGGFKEVYIGSNHAQNVAVAWNQICFDEKEEADESFYSEALLLKALNHTNIMKCYAFWLDYEKKSMNMITELFVFGSLRQYVKKLGGVDVETVQNWGKQILQGLLYLHTRVPRIVHRDLKCANIFVDVVNGGEIKIGDFGLATAMEGVGPLRTLVGTPEFMAPEYYDEEYNELVDVYAFGMCLLEMVTLECPYSECTNQAQIFRKVSTGVKPRALERVENSEVKSVIEKCLLPASSRPSAGDLLKDPFFSSSSSQISMENNQEEEMDDDESILSGISALYDSMSLSDATDASMNSSVASSVSVPSSN